MFRRVRFLVAAVMAISVLLPVGAAHAGTVAVNARIQGAGSVASVAGGPYSCSKTSNQDERVTVDCQRETFGAVFDASVTLVPTPSPSPSGQWQFAGWQGCQSISGNQCTVTSGAFSLDERFPKAIFVDVSNPTITSDGETFGNRSATFFFHSNEPADFFCRLNLGPLERCGLNATFPAGKTYSSLAEGSHIFSVHAVDPSGQSSTTLQRSITIVDTAISNGPAELVNSRTSTFDYSTVGGNAFECSVDFAAFEPCGSGATGSKEVTVLTDGPHSFRVRAKNGGFIDPVPAAHSWKVDTVRPAGTISINGGKARTRKRAVTLALSAADQPTGPVTLMRFRNKGTTAWSTWQAYGATRSWTLTRKTGTKTVQAQFQDPAGNISPTVVDSIVYKP
jgi:hypothetical protein